MADRPLKNEDMPAGRVDWQKRTPRWRVSLNHKDLAIMVEMIQEYFNHHPGKVTDPNYYSLKERFENAKNEIQQPLLGQSLEENYSLYQDWDLDE